MLPRFQADIDAWKQHVHYTLSLRTYNISFHFSAYFGRILLVSSPIPGKSRQVDAGAMVSRALLLPVCFDIAASQQHSWYAAYEGRDREAFHVADLMIFLAVGIFSKNQTQNFSQLFSSSYRQCIITLYQRYPSAGLRLLRSAASFTLFSRACRILKFISLGVYAQTSFDASRPAAFMNKFPTPLDLWRAISSSSGWIFASVYASALHHQQQKNFMLTILH